MKLVKFSNVLLIVVTLTLFFACKKDKINIIEPEIDPGKPAETMPGNILLRKTIHYNKFRDGIGGPLMSDTLIYNEKDQLIKVEHVNILSKIVYTFSYNENGSLSTVRSKSTLAEGYTNIYSLKYNKGLLDSITWVSDIPNDSADGDHVIINPTRNDQGQVTTVKYTLYSKTNSSVYSAQFDFLWTPSNNLASMQGRTYDYTADDVQRTTFPSVQNNHANIGLSRLPAGYLFLLALRENGLSYQNAMEPYLFTTYLYTSAKNVFNDGTGRLYNRNTRSNEELIKYVDYENKATFDQNGVLKTFNYFENNIYPVWDMVGIEFFYEQKK
ncbi:hypothetical protein [Chitinophaga pinensis]|uniref:DUF4595 domain-containing protein n=1 Tax=Chitinophaga pinensis (strain ATCC 43595 / DSM 2588 / LMG 13176 / NBRC 15968 / NCIMB 11800 / UQM 2034) TaxID=485918 RepID=A0A979GAY0_CHIPD|nr:hypothetical protein [Chitinophaga pinensis]ACU64179.1 hypothetical protein Cpin_6778 [Chitinophaga pinensis DSM 2588]